MWIRLRQIAVACEDLHKTGLDIGAVLGVEPCYTDPGVAQFGLKNTLWPIGTQFLEVVTPTADNTAAGRYRDRRGGDTGYMVINQVDDVAHRRARAEELGVRVAFDLHHPDAGHDGIQLHPADTGGSFFELDQMTMEGGETVGGPWYPAGKQWQPFVRKAQVSGISAAELQSPEPRRLAQRWASIAELDVHDDESGNPSIEFDNATLRFVEEADGRGEGLGGIDLTTEDRDTVLANAKTRGCYVSDDEVAVAGLRMYLR
jgi:hypothetical protein